MSDTAGNTEFDVDATVRDIISMMNANCRNMEDAREIISRLANAVGYMTLSSEEFEKKLQDERAAAELSTRNQMEGVMSEIIRELVAHDSFCRNEKIRIAGERSSLGALFSNLKLEQVKVDPVPGTPYDHTTMDAVDFEATDDPGLGGKVARFHDEGYWTFGVEKSVVSRMPVTVYNYISR